MLNKLKSLRAALSLAIVLSGVHFASSCSRRETVIDPYRVEQSFNNMTSNVDEIFKDYLGNEGTEDIEELKNLDVYLQFVEQWNNQFDDLNIDKEKVEDRLKNNNYVLVDGDGINDLINRYHYALEEKEEEEFQNDVNKEIECKDIAELLYAQYCLANNYINNKASSFTADFGIKLLKSVLISTNTYADIDSMNDIVIPREYDFVTELGNKTVNDDVMLYGNNITGYYDENNKNNWPKTTVDDNQLGQVYGAVYSGQHKENPDDDYSYNDEKVQYLKKVVSLYREVAQNNYEEKDKVLVKK